MSEIKEINEADEIVSLVKKMSSELQVLRIPADINFMGCSESYVQEKIWILQSDLKWLSQRMKDCNKSQVLARKKETRIK